jgi:hypothetical protein
MTNLALRAFLINFGKSTEELNLKIQNRGRPGDNFSFA